jgi:hypothetical protein
LCVRTKNFFPSLAPKYIVLWFVVKCIPLTAKYQNRYVPADCWPETYRGNFCLINIWASAL